jgi:hypothetical protein
MAIVSSPWCLSKVVHIAETCSSRRLVLFLRRVFTQVCQISPSETYDKAKQSYPQLAVVLHVLKTGNENLRAAYDLAVTEISIHASKSRGPTTLDPDSHPRPSTTVDADLSANSSTQNSPGSNPVAAGNTAQFASNAGPEIHSTVDTLDSSSKIPGATPQSTRSYKEGSSAQRTSTSSSLDSVRKSYGALFSDFRRDKGKGKAIAVI